MSNPDGQDNDGSSTGRGLGRGCLIALGTLIMAVFLVFGFCAIAFK